MSRRPAFDPARLDDDLDQLLPPPPRAVSTASAATPSAVDTDQDQLETGEPQALEPTEGEADSAVHARPNRGSGGRPRRGQADTDETTVVSAVRIPKPLYDALVQNLLGGMVERPSYAQIVAWTCEDHPDDVLAEINHAVSLAARAPRGRKLATEGVPLALRFRRDERSALDDLVARAKAGPTTRTAAVTAALRVAVKHGLPSTVNVGPRT